MSYLGIWLSAEHHIPYSEVSHEERPYRRAQIMALTKAEIPKENIEQQCLVKRRTLQDITNHYVRTGKYNNIVEAAAAFNHGHQRDVSAETVRLLLLKRGA
ncbi:hypothetical protein SAICODRAFT_30158, partial [Saitoella complicata NRRL Y-17804]|uniref:uncharacterized protein n=1 Tax=Saitoella complicata (strain BCRC 22490 / CBS 7301 / JCM 7358 / NBRC 10748 / NRRL Y-17804) TaxID=698492 RepID=UPI0008671BCC